MKLLYAMIMSIAGSLAAFAADNDLLDTLLLGDTASETAHRFTGEASKVVSGGYNTKARKILKPAVDCWQSDAISFTLKVDSAARNYITVKFWGGDITHDHLMMLIDGKQMGYMHLGEYDLLDYEQCEPRDAAPETNPAPQYLGRFTYTTFLLPETATKGKHEIAVSIRAVGKIWGYGNDFAQFQKNVSQDSRGIYAVYTHRNSGFAPLPADLELTQIAPATPPLNIKAVNLDAVKKRVNDEIAKSLKSDPRRDEWRLSLLSEAYFVPWSTGYQNPQILDYAVAAMDDLALRYVKEPGKVIAKGSWTGLAAPASAVILLAEPLQSKLDQEIDDGKGGMTKRRDLWCDVLEASTFQLVRDRRWLANQTQIVDNAGHRVNRATHILNDKRGVPLEITLNFVKEALGLRPWSHGINPDLSIADPKNTPGQNYYELTQKRLSKEWGYVGNYGESTIWTSADIYEGTIDRKTGQGDPEIYQVMQDAAIARTIFRYPGVTADNHPVMRLEVYIDWRNAHFPGEPSYVGKNLDLRSIYYTLNSQLLSAFKAMVEDGCLGDNVAESLKPGQRPDFVRMLHFPTQYQVIQSKLAGVPAMMPMRGGDFVFGDPEIGVVAFKDGDEINFFELYWRAKFGINHLAKVHRVTPKFEQIATVYQDEEFLPADEFYTRPDWVIYGFRGPRFNYPGGNYHQLLAGTKIPVAEHTSDSTMTGKAEFYHCSFGDYEIAVNASRINKRYSFVVPAGNWRRLPDGPSIAGNSNLELAPGDTAVLKKQ